ELVLKARKVFPRDPAVALAVGRAHFSRGDFASARPLLQEAVTALPENPEAVYYLGMTRFKSGDRTRGLEDLRTSVSMGLPGALAAEATKVLIEADTASMRP
ncbi:MAG: tetratricopeptide repeat protein, partial [Akkermansiaceae bacterium]|nr:tetratricopeptide repeat protein [Verrucomicrobiales bacterium]